RTVGTTGLFLGANEDRLDDVPLLHVAARACVLDGGDDDVTESGVTTTGAAENANREQRLGAGVVGDLDSGFLLKHKFVFFKASWRVSRNREARLLGVLQNLCKAPTL